MVRAMLAHFRNLDPGAGGVAESGERLAKSMQIVNTEKLEFKFLIDGEMTGSKTFDLVNPSTGEVFAKAADASLEDAKRAIAAARKAFDSGDWSGLKVEQRGKFLLRIAELIRENAKELADLETLSTGKTSKQATFIDVPTCADTFEYFSKAGELLRGHANHVAAPVKSRTDREPMGVVGCIIPWNYPLIMTAWKIAPALLAGNTIVFKPSRLGCAAVLKLAQIIEQAGLPAGTVNIFTTTSPEAAGEIVKSPDVDMVSFTGGTETGREVMKIASGTVKKISLELGGKSPNIVFGDCDFEAALGGTMSAIFMNQGQMCTAGSRLLVEESIAEKFTAALVEKTKSLKIGPATNYDTDFGPMISAEQRDKVLRMVQKSSAEGAKVLCGGKIPADLNAGFYFEPTILGNIHNQMAIAREEIFGPVLCVMTFKTEDEAIAVANDSPFGLAACVWTKDSNKANRVAKKLQCGTVWVNTYGGFYNEASFGGYKQSGFGRELGAEGLLEFTQSKNVCIDATPGGRPLVSSWF